MDSFEKELSNSQKQGWLTRLVALGLIGLLTALVVVEVFSYSDLQQLIDEQANEYLFNFLLLGFVVLAFVSMGYLTLKELSSKKLKTDLAKQKIMSWALEIRVTELEAVHELTTLVNSDMALFDVLDSICNKAQKTLSADQSSLFLYDPETNKLLCVSVWGPQNELVKDAVIKAGEGVAGWVIEHRQPLCLDRDADESKFNGFIKKCRKISSSLCLPLVVKNQARGVLNLTLFDQARKFATSDLKLASIFAENASMAIEKTGLYERLEMQTETMKAVIKELKATQQQSANPQTVLALSNLARGMARDFGNTLGTILEKVQLLLREISEASIPEKTKQRVFKLLRTTEQMASDGAETARHIKAFTGTFQGDSHEDFEQLDINAIVLKAIEAAKPKWKYEAELKAIRIEVQTDLEELPHPPMGNPPEMKSVLTSMIYNSIDALPGGGRISISTKTREDGIEIKVADDGIGMSEEVKKKIFRPFFTTKREGGYGIGLSAAQRIVSSHNGQMSVESTPNEGTTFTITLPIKDYSREVPAREPQTTSWKGLGTAEV
jgi:signal transduction histidine kinase